MLEQIIDVFDVNTDAIATNKGFYYQYLSVLKKWVSNFVEDQNIETFTEVDQDIKEVGENLLFTQVKCYTSNFSLNSKEIKNTIFNFFMLYMKNKHLVDEMSFCFSTNTKIATKEKLLSRWVNDDKLNDNDLKELCCNKIYDVLIKEIKAKKNNKLNQKNSIEKREIINLSAESFVKIVNDEVENFTKAIQWKFENLTPDEAIKNIKTEIEKLLVNKKFNNRPTNLLFGVLISEIYKRSQNIETSERSLTNEIIIEILNQSDKDLEKYLNAKFFSLINIEIELLKDDLKTIVSKVEGHEIKINSLEKSITSNKNNSFPKHLNLIPDYNSISFFDWEDFLNTINIELNQKKIVSIYGPGGVGKSSFAKKYLKTYDIYDHVIWINVENSISYAFSFDEILLNNLKIEFSENDNIEHKLKLITNQIGRIEGNNLLIVDIQNANDEIQGLKLLSVLSGWHKIILTRSHLKNIQSFKLPKLNFNNAKTLFLSYLTREIIGDDIIEDFFKLIEYNVLVIELTAKTIENSIDLTLNSFINSLKEQKLDNSEFNIDIDILDENDSIRIFQFILKKFSFNNLSVDEKTYLDYLSLLPSTIYIDDIILINGIESYNENKITISNIINSLEKKGLVEYSSDKKRISIHKIIREVTIYNAREKNNPFFNCYFYIIWLTSRLKDAQNNPSKSFKFLRYAESILDSIKEKYRESIYQPLLILENELLYLYTYYFNTEVENSRWINLTKRAEKKLEMDDVNLGVIYNNLALSEDYNDNKENAIIYFKKALAIIEKNELKYIDLIISISNNISNIYLKSEDLVNALNYFKKVLELRNKYSYFNDQQLGIEYGILADSYQIAGDYDKAIELITDGITLHLSLDSSQRNDFYLSMYYNKLSSFHIFKKDLELALISQEKCVEILEFMQLLQSEHLLQMYRMLLNLYKVMGLKDKERILIDKINANKK